jgi:hypothetical protein
MSFPDPLPLARPLPDPDRRLAACPLVIFIAYTISPEAEARGYADWLKRVDMPFFNAIPGTRHYANWRLAEILAGLAPDWDWFDFQGLETADDLERVWFHPELDAFRKGWLELWGYASETPPPVLRHAYTLRPVFRADRSSGSSATATLSAGTGDAPGQEDADIVFRVTETLHKHFGGRDASRPWWSAAEDFNPLGFDWLALNWSDPAPMPDATFSARARLVAAPDRE